MEGDAELSPDHNNEDPFAEIEVYFQDSDNNFYSLTGAQGDKDDFVGNYSVKQNYQEWYTTNLATAIDTDGYHTTSQQDFQFGDLV